MVWYCILAGRPEWQRAHVLGSPTFEHPLVISTSPLRGGGAHTGSHEPERSRHEPELGGPDAHGTAGPCGQPMPLGRPEEGLPREVGEAGVGTRSVKASVALQAVMYVEMAEGPLPSRDDVAYHLAHHVFEGVFVRSC